MLGFLLWLILLVFCRPLALLAFVLYPLVWLLLLPVRIVGVAVDGAFGSFGLSSRCRLASCAAHDTREPHADAAVPMGRPLPRVQPGPRRDSPFRLPAERNDLLSPPREPLARWGIRREPYAHWWT